MSMTLGGVNQSVGTYNTIDNSAQKIIPKVSTGSDYSSESLPSDAYAISVNSENNTREIAQSIQNTQNISSMVKIAESATNSTVKSLAMIERHLLNVANNTNGFLDRRALQREINKIVAQMDANSHASYNGTNFQIGDLSTQALGLTDTQGNVKISVSTSKDIDDSLKVVDSAFTQVGEILDSMHFMQEYVVNGFSFNRIFDKAEKQDFQFPQVDFIQANYMTREENQRAALSNSNDYDITQQMAQFRSEQTQQQLAFSASKMFDQNRLGVLTLLP